MIFSFVRTQNLKRDLHFPTHDLILPWREHLYGLPGGGGGIKRYCFSTDVDEQFGTRHIVRWVQSDSSEGQPQDRNGCQERFATVPTQDASEV